MAYRDAVAAARTRVTEAQEVAAGLEERITPALLDQLPARLGEDLANAAADAEATAARVAVSTELSEMDQAVDALRRYAEILEDAIARAPRLARSYNRLPRAFPERTSTRFTYHFPDVFSPAQQSLRRTLHADIDRMDPKARLFDKRAGYYDSHPTPYLVEACFRVGWNPIRLQVAAWQLDVQRTTGYHVELVSAYCLVSGVRPSTPAMKLTLNGVKSGFLAMLGLLRDTRIGDDEIDKALVVDADAEDAARVLRPEVLEPLRGLMRKGELHVIEIANELARIEWYEDVTIKAQYGGGPVHEFTSHALADAVSVMVGIRQTPPIPLLRQLERRRGADR